MSPLTAASEIGTNEVPIDELIAKSSIGVGLTNIRANGIEAELADVEEEMPPKKRRKSRSSESKTSKSGLDADADADLDDRDDHFSMFLDMPPAPSEDGKPKKKRRKPASPTERTLKECRRRGWEAGIVERRIPFPKPQGTTIDLFGVIDIVAIVPDDGRVRDIVKEACLAVERTAATAVRIEQLDAIIDRAVAKLGIGTLLAIQATSGSNHASRVAKVLAEPRAAAWVATGNRLEVWSWSPLVARNKNGSKAKVRRLTLRVETYAEMLAESEAGR